MTLQTRWQKKHAGQNEEAEGLMRQNRVRPVEIKRKYPVPGAASPDAGYFLLCLYMSTSRLCFFYWVQQGHRVSQNQNAHSLSAESVFLNFIF
jgi:hypothetical protein